MVCLELFNIKTISKIDDIRSIDLKIICIKMMEK